MKIRRRKSVATTFLDIYIEKFNDVFLTFQANIQLNFFAQPCGNRIGMLSSQCCIFKKHEESLSRWKEEWKWRERVKYATDEKKKKKC